MIGKIKHAWNVLKMEGGGYFLKKAFLFFIGQSVGLVAYPFCRVFNIRFISVTTSAIGHLAGELDCYVKEGLLGLRPHYNTVMLAPFKSVVNQHFLTYWEKHVRIIQDPILCFLLSPLRCSVFLRYDVGKYFGYKFASLEASTVQKKYGDRPALLSLTDADRKRGWDVLNGLGVPCGAWFVCVHCREGGYGKHKIKQAMRNVDVNTYLPAIQEIVARGGWVIRLGDPTMRPIPRIEKVIDYAHSDVKSDWMDVFLCGSCRFFFGSNSGLAILASTFGVPGAIANIAGPISTVLPYGPRDIGIPKLVRSIKEGRYFKFKEIFSSSIGNLEEDALFFQRGIQWVDNSPEDITGLMLEVLESLEGKIDYSKEDERLQERFKAFLNATHFSYGAPSRVGRAFLRKYRDLLE